MKHTEQLGLALYSHHTIYHVQGKSPTPSAVPAYSKAFFCYTGEMIACLSISQTEYRAEEFVRIDLETEAVQQSHLAQVGIKEKI